MNKSYRTGMHQLREVWIVAEREILAIIRTKGFWFNVLITPIFLSLTVLFFWITFSFLSSTMRDAEIDMNTLMQEMPDLVDSANFVQHYFWGDPLHFYVVDHTGSLKENIRQTILSRDNDALLEAYGGRGPITLEELEHLLTEDSHYGLDPLVSYRWFRELREPHVSEAELSTWLESGQISGYFVIPDNFLSSNDDPTFVRPSNASPVLADKLAKLKRWFEEIVTAVRQDALLSDTGVDTETQEQLMESVNVNVTRRTPNLEPSSKTGTNGINGWIPTISIASWVKFTTIPYVYFLIVVMGNVANAVVMSTVEEKSNKVAEMLVARLHPSQIMDGKILAYAIVMMIGVLIFTLIVGPPTILFLGTVFGYDSNAFVTILHPSKLLNWLLFLTLGFALFGYIQSALGALCNELKETVMTLYPVAMIQLLGVIPAVIYVMFSPDGKIAQVLSFIPILTPGVMVARSAALPHWSIYLIIVLMMCLSVILVRWFATKVFAHGMTSDRAPHGLRRVVRLARSPV